MAAGTASSGVKSGPTPVLPKTTLVRFRRRLAMGRCDAACGLEGIPRDVGSFGCERRSEPA